MKNRKANRKLAKDLASKINTIIEKYNQKTPYTNFYAISSIPDTARNLIFFVIEIIGLVSVLYYAAWRDLTFENPITDSLEFFAHCCACAIIALTLLIVYFKVKLKLRRNHHIKLGYSNQDIARLESELAELEIWELELVIKQEHHQRMCEKFEKLKPIIVEELHGSMKLKSNLLKVKGKALIKVDGFSRSSFKISRKGYHHLLMEISNLKDMTECDAKIEQTLGLS